MRFSFIVASNDRETLNTNFLASPIFNGTNNNQIIIQEGYCSAASAYNDGIKKAKNDVLILLHQDVYLPYRWDKLLASIIEKLDSRQVNWGVLGAYGVDRIGGQHGYVYTNGLKRVLGKNNKPEEVQSLDELLLVVRKSSGIFFDYNLPHFHLYGTDICMIAQKMGYRAFSISNFCIHNSLPIFKLPDEYWKCVRYLRKKWKRDLPIRTCVETLHKSWVQNTYSRLRNDIYYYFHRDLRKGVDRMSPKEILELKI